MLLIKTEVKNSEVSGLGLFALEDIPKGKIIWKFNPIIDKRVTVEEFKSQPTEVQYLIEHFAFLSQVSGLYVLPFDNDRFMNHSTNDYNIDSIVKEGEEEKLGIANRDILKG